MRLDPDKGFHGQEVHSHAAGQHVSGRFREISARRSSSAETCRRRRGTSAFPAHNGRDSDVSFSNIS